MMQLTLDLRDFWNFGDPAASRAKFEDLLSHGQDDELANEIRCQIGRTYGLEGSFDQAHQLLDSLTIKDDTALRSWACWHLEKGRTLNSSGKKEEARPLFERAAESHWQDLRIDALHMLAIVSSGEEALDWNQTALKEASAATMPQARRWVGSLSNNLGWSLHDLNRFDEALEVFKTAEAFFAEKGGQQHHIAKWAVARCLRSMSRHEEALEILLALDGSADGYVPEEIGENYLSLGELDKAKEQLKLAFDLHSQDDWVVKNEAEKLERLKDLSA